MIRSNKGEVGIHGTKEEVLADLSTLIYALKEDVSKEDIMCAVERAFMTKEQIEKAVAEKIIKMILGGM